MYEVYNSPSVLEAGDDGTNEATLSIELETSISRGTLFHYKSLGRAYLDAIGLDSNETIFFERLD